MPAVPSVDNRDDTSGNTEKQVTLTECQIVYLGGRVKDADAIMRQLVLALLLLCNREKLLLAQHAKKITVLVCPHGAFDWVKYSYRFRSNIGKEFLIFA